MKLLTKELAMSLPYVPTTSSSNLYAESPNADTSLCGRRLVLARSAWVVVAVLLVALFIAGIPADYNQKMPLFAEPHVQANLSELGLSVGAYAAYYLILTGAFTLGFCIIGAVIFWRK